MSFTFHQSRRLGFHGEQGLSMMQSRWGGQGEGDRVLDPSPTGSCQEPSEDRIQIPEPGEAGRASQLSPL